MAAEGRLLRPWRVLARFRPVTIRAASGRLREFYRLGQAAGLVAGHLPHLLSDELAGLAWYQVLAFFLEEVEKAGWFEIDMEAVDYAWRLWQFDEDDDGDHLAHFLAYIPVRLYGVNDEAADESPVLELMRFLFGGPRPLNEAVISRAGLHDLIEGWDRAAAARAWGWLERIEADPGQYPEPARWLPEFVRWACGRTGNYILDSWRGALFSVSPFTWEMAGEVRVAWRRAWPVLDRFEGLVAWLEQDEARLALLARCLIEGINYDHLEW